ncbi:hypothetical protein PP724_22935 [Ralstonia solanacearum]|uniref:hypothetical protein n=1 Tax=Ralstonia solanacearum TaxID=305 RepID=UPI001FFA4BBC|nr:hypothetical protein [Ralstonia solanacearum]MDC6237023.1 hypothetical protein [Ralstonia solanacearum]MDD7810574.1 hypothetical protein [Ralstonia solanacearum]
MAAPILTTRRHILRKTFFHAVLPLMLAAPAASAMASDAITAANNTIGLAIGGQNLAYHESPEGTALNIPSTIGTGSAALPDGYLDSQIGTMPALSLSASRQGEVLGIPDVFTALNVMGAMGTTEYVGSQYTQHCNGIPGTSWYCSASWPSLDPHTRRDKTYTLDVLAKIGKAFPIGQRAQVTPYVSVGAHGLDRHMNRYWHLLAGPGVLVQYAVTGKLVVGADLAVQEVFSAHARESGVNYSLGSRPAVGLGLSADYAVTRRLHLTASYNLQRFRYGASPTQRNPSSNWKPYAFEPSSKTAIQSVMVGIAWAY